MPLPLTLLGRFRPFGAHCALPLTNRVVFSGRGNESKPTNKQGIFLGTTGVRGKGAEFLFFSVQRGGGGLLRCRVSLAVCLAKLVIGAACWLWMEEGGGHGDRFK